MLTSSQRFSKLPINSWKSTCANCHEPMKGALDRIFCDYCLFRLGESNLAGRYLI